MTMTMKTGGCEYKILDILDNTDLSHLKNCKLIDIENGR